MNVELLVCPVKLRTQRNVEGILPGSEHRFDVGLRVIRANDLFCGPVVLVGNEDHATKNGFAKKIECAVIKFVGERQPGIFSGELEL